MAVPIQEKVLAKLGQKQDRLRVVRPSNEEDLEGKKIRLYSVFSIYK